MGQGTLQPGAGARWTCQGVDKVGHAEFPPCKRLRYIRKECAIAQPHANEHTPHQTIQATRACRFGLLSGGPSAQLIAVSLPHSEYGSAYVRHRAVAVATRVVSCACTPVAVVSTRSNPTRLQRSLPRRCVAMEEFQLLFLRGDPVEGYAHGNRARAPPFAARLRGAGWDGMGCVGVWYPLCSAGSAEYARPS